jgi:hypothetical protein
MKTLDYYIYLIFTFKILFIILAIMEIYYRRKHLEFSDKGMAVAYWKSRVDFIFIGLMALLLIYVFRPNQDKDVVVKGEMRLLFFLFGIILIITANWDIFFKSSVWFNDLQGIL